MGPTFPSQQRTTREARQLVSVGETYDFELQPAPGQRRSLELRRANGEWINADLARRDALSPPLQDGTDPLGDYLFGGVDVRLHSIT